MGGLERFIKEVLGIELLPYRIRFVEIFFSRKLPSPELTESG